ncbi:MAG: hypothetical protein L3J67_06995 [Hyphomicrobiaceae bacterium]|nr:hypothetical protein [Hyphomicrobiaceae bacterium]
MAKFNNNIQITDIIIHVDESINNLEEEVLLGELRKVDGVMTPGFNRPHLMLVTYNPEKVNSYELLSTVRSEGYHAQLIGI